MKQLLKLNENSNNANNNIELIKKHIDSNFESLFNKINTIEHTFNNKLDELNDKINYGKSTPNVYIEVNDTKENSKKTLKIILKIYTTNSVTKESDNDSSSDSNSDSNSDDVTPELCKNTDCVAEKDDEYSESCNICDGYYKDDGLNDILFIEESPNNKKGSCDLCKETNNIVQMKGTGQYICQDAYSM